MSPVATRPAWSLGDLLRLLVSVALIEIGVLVIVGTVGLADGLGAACIALGLGLASLW